MFDNKNIFDNKKTYSTLLNFSLITAQNESIYNTNKTSLANVNLIECHPKLKTSSPREEFLIPYI